LGNQVRAKGDGTGLRSGASVIGLGGDGDGLLGGGAVEVAAVTSTR